LRSGMSSGGYPAPQGSQTMVAVEKSLQGDGETQFAWWPINASVVEVTSLTDAIYLRFAFSYRLTDINGAALLDDHEVWVDDEDRLECERMLRENCHCPSSAQKWFELFEVEFADDDEHRRFGASFTALTGLPNAFTPGATPTVMEAAGMLGM
jgi:hypothetical protein